MKCSKCQLENLETRRFCHECGAKLVHICPKCSYENLPGDKFCGQCGYSLPETKSSLMAQYSEPRSYVPKYLADKIISSRSSIEGERKLITILFADCVDYTSISEKLDPEEVHHLMDGCFKLLIDEIHSYEGTVDKFTGDGIVALFGAPIASEYHAQQACYAALAIQTALLEYSLKVEKDWGIEFKMRLGLNSGPVLVSAIGNDLKMDYTVIGDTVNLASRMQSMAKPGTILVSPNTYKITSDFFEFKPMGQSTVKGKEEQLEVYELLGAAATQTRFEASLAKGLTRFVGRKKEISALKEAFEMAQSGSGHIVGVTGEAGIGKSRIIHELTKTLPYGHHKYLGGRCFHYGSPIAYLPILEILRSYFDIKEGEKEFESKKKIANKISELDDRLRQIIVPLHDLLSLRVEDEEYLRIEPVIRKERVFEAIRDLTVRESQNEPLVISIDDLQWIDKASEELLDYLTAWLVNAKVLLLLIYRLGYSHPWEAKSYYTRIHLSRLPVKASTELLQSVLRDAEVTPELRELILARSEGNPLFIEEFTQSLIETGYIQKMGERYALRTEISSIQVPDTIQGIINARIDRLEESLKRTIQLASVVGRDFTYRILYNITGTQQELKSQLTKLQHLEFIYERSLLPESEYVFKHAVTQDVSYHSLPVKKRKHIHEKVGMAIEGIYSGRLEEFYEKLAYHFSESDNWEKAYHYNKLSGDKLSERYSNAEAFRFYKEAIKSLKKLPATDENKRRLIEISLLIEGPMTVLAYPHDSLEILVDTHGQSPWHFTVQASLDLNPAVIAISHTQ